MSKPKFNPCPFCGCEEITYRPEDYERDAFCMCENLSCGARMYYDDLEALVKAWNRRPDKPLPVFKETLRIVSGTPGIEIEYNTRSRKGRFLSLKDLSVDVGDYIYVCDLSCVVIKTTRKFRKCDCRYRLAVWFEALHEKCDQEER